MWRNRGSPQHELLLMSQSLHTCWRKEGRVIRPGQEWGAGRSLHPPYPGISTRGSTGLQTRPGQHRPLSPCVGGVWGGSIWFGAGGRAPGLTGRLQEGGHDAEGKGVRSVISDR